jgi:ABC-type branched-subunit amino acid transport system substrate-binding protein
MALLTVTLLLLAAPTRAAEPIKFGFLDDLSAGAAESGNDGAHAVEFAIEEINAKGGINGRKVALTTYDGKMEPQLWSTFARRLIEEDRVLVVIGGNPAVPTAATIPVINEYKIPYLSLSAATDSFTNPPTPFHFRLGPSNSQDAAAIADVLLKQGFKRVAIINNSLPYGLDGGKAASRALEQRGMTVVAHEVYELNATDVSPQVIKIRNANPEALIVWPYPADGGRVMRTTKQLQLTVPKVIARIAQYDAFRDLSGDAAEGAFVTNTVDPARADVQAFMKKFTAKYGYRPATMYIALAYDAANVAFRAIGTEKVQAALAKGDIAAARDAVRVAIETIGKFPSIQGHGGAVYQFGPNQHQGPPDSNWFVWNQVRGGKLAGADMSELRPKK